MQPKCIKSVFFLSNQLCKKVKPMEPNGYHEPNGLANIMQNNSNRNFSNTPQTVSTEVIPKYKR